MNQTVEINQSEVYEEVAKATDYTGSKMTGEDSGARERILATDEVLGDLGRFWDESVLSVNEKFKDMLVSSQDKNEEVEKIHQFTFEVSANFDINLVESIQQSLKNFFILSIIAQWFKYTNKKEAQDYFNQSAEMVTAAERLLYSRKKPSIPT